MKEPDSRVMSVDGKAVVGRVEVAHPSKIIVHFGQELFFAGA